MSEIMAVHLKCNDQESPLGIDTYCPALGWELQSGELGTKGSRTEGPGTGGPGQWQTAFRILVSSSPDMLATNQGDFWDTGKVASEQQLFIPYGGRALSSGQSYWWKVKVWDQGMNEGPWSRPACFETGLFLQEDWKARWIAASRGGLFTRSDGSPEPLFRYEFTLRALPVKARAYICGLGYHELTVNGRKMSDDVLAPGVTRYDASVLYQTLDVTPALTAGANAVGVMLGDGWYNCFTQEVWDFKQAPWRDFAKLLFEMHVTYADGTKECITSGPEWKTAQGPVTFAGLRNGEHYDARLEIPGWDRPGFDDSCWKPAFITRAPGGILRSQQMPPIRVTRTLKPVSMTQTGEGTYVYDAGQNLSGWARIRVQGPAGTVVTLRYGERIKEDGSLDQEKIAVFIKSGDCQTDRYTLKGEGIEEWEPRFTYHGFQYIEMTGYPGTPDLHSLSI
ncbi:MAG TPA: alpha-L-rhamnosidase, partial [Clostridiales bacterium]|nr:alpha-L-rhamnosidase [Clostridiales bacterium]